MNKIFINLILGLPNYLSCHMGILSAGWGIVNSGFRIPKYTITFSSNSKIAVHYKRKSNDNLVKLIKYETNWHYDCAKKLLGGELNETINR